MGLLIGVMVAFSILPVIAIECLSRKGYIFSIILSFVYASASFEIVFAISNVLTPFVCCFQMGITSHDYRICFRLRIGRLVLNSPACIGVLMLTAIASLTIAIVYKKQAGNLGGC